MIIVCEKCRSRFKLDESRIKGRRFKVRCSRCGHVFSAAKPDVPPTAAPSSSVLPPPLPGRAKVVCVSNQKGGVAKTTTCLNLGVALAQLQLRVLLIDFDVQSNLTISLGYRNKPSFYDIVKAAPERQVDDFVIRTPYEGLSLLPANKNMVLLNKSYFGAPRYEFILRDRLQGLQDRFDYILVDTPPSIEFFTLNALTASDLVIIPTQCDYLSTHGVDQILQLIDLVRRKTNPEVGARILVTLYEHRATASRVVLNKLQQIYRGRTFKTMIHYDDKLREAQIMSLPVTHYDRGSRSGKEYQDLAREILDLAGGEVSAA